MTQNLSSVGSWVQTIKSLGVPVAVLVFVALVFIGFLPSPMLELQKASVTSLAQHRAITERFYVESVRLARINCLNLAKLAHREEIDCLPLFVDDPSGERRPSDSAGDNR